MRTHLVTLVFLWAVAVSTAPVQGAYHTYAPKGTTRAAVRTVCAGGSDPSLPGIGARHYDAFWKIPTGQSVQVIDSLGERCWIEIPKSRVKSVAYKTDGGEPSNLNRRAIAEWGWKNDTLGAAVLEACGQPVTYVPAAPAQAVVAATTPAPTPAPVATAIATVVLEQAPPVAPPAVFVPVVGPAPCLDPGFAPPICGPQRGGGFEGLLLAAGMLFNRPPRPVVVAGPVTNVQVDRSVRMNNVGNRTDSRRFQFDQSDHRQFTQIDSSRRMFLQQFDQRRYQVDQSYRDQSNRTFTQLQMRPPNIPYRPPQQPVYDTGRGRLATANPGGAVTPRPYDPRTDMSYQSRTDPRNAAAAQYYANQRAQQQAQLRQSRYPQFYGGQGNLPWSQPQQAFRPQMQQQAFRPQQQMQQRGRPRLMR